MARLTRADVAYVRAGFVVLERLCAGRPETPEEIRTLISDRRLPRPSYVLDDGSEMFPTGYFRLLDEAGAIDELRGEFVRRFRRAAVAHVAAEAEAAWRTYLDGTYGICLREATPEAIVRKSQLVSKLCELMMLPEPTVSAWQEELRSTVQELDALERDFAPNFDRDPARGRLPTRDLLINAARAAYPEIFEEGSAADTTAEEEVP